MKTILTIMKKEFARVFKDRKLVLMIFIFPGLMIFMIYSIMGSALVNIVSNEDETPAIVYSSNIPLPIAALLANEELNFKAEYHEITELAKHQEDLRNGNIDYIIVFPASFNEDIINNLKPKVEYYYNPTSQKSSSTYNTFVYALTTYENILINDKYGDIDIFTSEETTVINEEKTIALTMAMLLPFLIITFLFQGAMSLAPESIAGEKERGTMASLLITPTKRGDLALGKILSLSALASLSAISSFLGIILSLPKMIGVSGVANIYGFGEYALVLLVLLVTVFVIIGIISTLSALAKNIKEASLIVLPVYIIMIVVSLSTMFSSTAMRGNMYYLLPIYNSVQILRQIFTFEINYWQLGITVLSNCMTALIFALVLTEMFKKEKIMLSK